MNEEKQYYTIIRDDLEEFYDSLVHVCGKEYADNMWKCIENRSHTQEPDKPRPPCEECIYQAQAAQERERLLKPFKKYADTLNEIECCVIQAKLWEMIESLRKGAP